MTFLHLALLAWDSNLNIILAVGREETLRATLQHQLYLLDQKPVLLQREGSLLFELCLFFLIWHWFPYSISQLQGSGIQEVS